MGILRSKGCRREPYELAAVHEKMGEQTMSVTVKPQETEKADFNYAMK